MSPCCLNAGPCPAPRCTRMTLLDSWLGAATQKLFIKTMWTKTGLEIRKTCQISAAALAALFTDRSSWLSTKVTSTFYLSNFCLNFTSSIRQMSPLPWLQIHYFSSDPKYFPSSQQDEAENFLFFMVNGVGRKWAIPKECYGIQVILFKQKRVNFCFH